MNSAILFVSIALACVVALALIVILPWLSGKTHASNTLMAINIDNFDNRLQELEADKATGFLNQKEYQIQLKALKRQLLSAQTHTPSYVRVSAKSRIVVLVWIVALVVFAYFSIDNRHSTWALWQAQDTLDKVADDLLTAKIDVPPDWAQKDSTALISAMQTNVYRHATDPVRWLRLSELFTSLDATKQALEALSRAHRLDPANDEIALTYAQMLLFAGDSTQNLDAMKAIDGVLQKNPTHEGAMMMKVIALTRTPQKQEALIWIGKLRDKIAQKSGDHSQTLAQLDNFVQTLRQDASTHTTQKSLQVQVQADMQPHQTLFVAISPKVGGAPYAVKRLNFDEFSKNSTVILDDSHAMLPGRTLSNAKEPLVVSARLSNSADALPQSGDMTSPSIALDAQSYTKGVILQINTAIP